jgi:hypothetical protein
MFTGTAYPLAASCFVVGFLLLKNKVNRLFHLVACCFLVTLICGPSNTAAFHSEHRAIANNILSVQCFLRCIENSLKHHICGALIVF